MNYEMLISSNVRKVFDLVGNLAKNATLSKKENVNFNFGNSTVSSTTSTLDTKVIVTEIETKYSSSKTNKKIALLKTQEIGDISTYSTISSENKTFKVGPTIRTDRFVTIVELYE
jgi:hypothetical protein